MDRSKIQVCVYDDRVEITSPGMLFGGLTIDMIKNGRTKIRNNAIAEVFSRMRVIEGWGSGIGRMIEDCREYGVAEPVFTEVGVDFRVEFFRKKTVADAKEKSTNSLQNDASLTQVLTQVLTQGDYLKMKPIIDYLEENESVTTKEAMELVKKSKSTALRYISKLIDAKVVAPEGNTDNLRYTRIK